MDARGVVGIALKLGIKRPLLEHGAEGHGEDERSVPARPHHEPSKSGAPSRKPSAPAYIGWRT